MNRLLIISTCSKRKRYRAAQSCRLDACIKGGHRETLRAWRRNREESGLARYPARLLYAGDHWTSTLECERLGRSLGVSTDLWVASAGWGLIPADMKICSYSATFSSGTDSVLNVPWPSGTARIDGLRTWWKGIAVETVLAQIRGVVESAPDTRRNLRVLAILSREYYLVLEPMFAEWVSSGLQLAIVSAGTNAETCAVSPLVRDSVLPLSERFRGIEADLDKSNSALNSRLAAWILRKYNKDLAAGVQVLRERLMKTAVALPKLRRRPVVPMTDAEVMAFIRSHYSEDNSTATRLLRKLRNEFHLSCEQHRFGRLFKAFLETELTPGMFRG